MVDFILPDGSSKTIPAAEINRFRSSLPHELYGQGVTLFDPFQVALGDIEEIAHKITTEAPYFVKFDSPDGSPHWINAKKVRDVGKPRPSEYSENVGAILEIGNLRLQVAQSVADANLILSKGRTA